MIKYELLHADCRAVMANMADDSVDSVVTDPPYHLTSIVKRFGAAGAAPAKVGATGAYARASSGFMGQQWDGGDIAFDPSLWAEVLRVLKPGGHLLAFSGSRTYHRMAVAIEDAGFEIRDQIMWLYGSGFPKSHDVSKGIDKAAGAEREVVGTRKKNTAVGSNDVMRENGKATGCANFASVGGDARVTYETINLPVTAPATPEAQQWEGWGTALKPAHEPIVLARKPLIGTVAANVLAHGTGAINIDGCRIDYAGAADEAETKTKNAHGDLGTGPMTNQIYGTFSKSRDNYDPTGRFPANVMHDGSDEVLEGFPDTKSGAHNVTYAAGEKSGLFEHGANGYQPKNIAANAGSAARFFYCAKASKADRDEGLAHLPTQAAGTVGNDGKPSYAKGSEPPRRANHHPTVKPEKLMRYLARLITPPGGLVFDPFTGSGSTGKAALLEGFRFIGAEMTAEYIPIARARLDEAVRRSYATTGKDSL